MKTRNFLLVLLITLLFSGCVVYSFYPLYTENDLFANDILTGEWYEGPEQEVKFETELGWKFEHPFIGNKKNGIVDSTSYILTLTTDEQGTKVVSKFKVHVIELAGHYFLDFYLDDFGEDDEVTLATFHIIPVHTFAKLTVEKDKLIINWFNPEWLEDLIKQNKIRIHHEKNDDYILLTAKPKELQKFVTKYVNSEEGLDEGLKVVLHRK
uniref:hypothetical protein n=1 Tax=uncultured Draconibacterium sp. TaxID=1573823 RepID=UPI00321788DE